MCETIVIREGDALRSVVETFIRNVYSAEHGAQLQTFLSRLFALMNERADIICAAGVRLQEDGFFSELYLDSPVEQALGAASKRTITRSEIFEVTTFASRAPRATMQFIKSLGMFGELNGFAWSFFTLTQRLHRLVERLGHPLTHLADADCRRIPGHQRWGTYYASQPKVFAIASPRLGLDGNVLLDLLVDAGFQPSDVAIEDVRLPFGIRGLLATAVKSCCAPLLEPVRLEMQP